MFCQTVSVAGFQTLGLTMSASTLPRRSQKNRYASWQVQCSCIFSSKGTTSCLFGGITGASTESPRIYSWEYAKVRQEKYCIYAVREPRGIPYSLIEALEY